MFVSCVIFVFLCCTSISLLNFTVLHVRLIRVLLKISQSVSQIPYYFAGTKLKINANSLAPPIVDRLDALVGLTGSEDPADSTY